MAELTISEAAQACGVNRSTLQRAVQAGRLSLTQDHRVDTAELLRVGFTLHAVPPPQVRRGRHAVQQAAAPQSPATAAPCPWCCTAGCRRRPPHCSSALRHWSGMLSCARFWRTCGSAVSWTDTAAWVQQLRQRGSSMREMERYDRLLAAPRAAPGPAGAAPQPQPRSAGPCASASCPASGPSGGPEPRADAATVGYREAARQYDDRHGAGWVVTPIRHRSLWRDVSIEALSEALQTIIYYNNAWITREGGGHRAPVEGYGVRRPQASGRWWALDKPWTRQQPCALTHPPCCRGPCQPQPGRQGCHSSLYPKSRGPKRSGRPWRTRSISRF